jgi:hypothetical protein
VSFGRPGRTDLLVAAAFGLVLVRAGVVLRGDAAVPIGFTAPATPAATANGRVDVSTSPPGSELYVDGRGAGSSPEHLDLSLGPHTLAAQRPDAVTETHGIDVGLAREALNLELWRFPRIAPLCRARRAAGDPRAGRSRPVAG